MMNNDLCEIPFDHGDFNVSLGTTMQLSLNRKDIYNIDLQFYAITQSRTVKICIKRIGKVASNQSAVSALCMFVVMVVGNRGV